MYHLHQRKAANTHQLLSLIHNNTNLNKHNNIKALLKRRPIRDRPLAIHKLLQAKTNTPVMMEKRKSHGLAQKRGLNHRTKITSNLYNTHHNSHTPQ